jgi:GNAT superfamily N-acetyltransferase
MCAASPHTSKLRLFYNFFFEEEDMEIEIRKAEERDIAGIGEIVRELGWFADINAEVPEETRTHITNEMKLCQADESHGVFVARATDGAVLGYVVVHWVPYLIHSGPDGYISELFLRESARGKGIGARLLGTVEAEAKRRGCTRLMLLNMRQRESYLRGFYSKHGWEERPQAATFMKKIGND